MDLRAFYQKMRKLEQEILTPHAVVVSLDTADGGKAGVKTEVRRELAAKLVVENKARLASAEEIEEFHNQLRAAVRERERDQAASRLRVNILSDDELSALRKPGRKQE